MAEPVQQFDVISMGRIGVDLYPLPPGMPSTQVRPYGRPLGGSIADVAARPARRPAAGPRTHTDPHGTHLHQTLTESAVDHRRAPSRRPLHTAPEKS
ncbi:hypothetical protein [Streptomyces sp. SID13726]|uniref:hypothetical protein n=1 Tax=Streptomyces sp. SID13726 TaxID=2706058 RepID=UPI0013BBF658|nr:hypothetical protein [Streptomyces sp. SID13726]NEA99361.1 hypothetical protein [Streptomyces sp. SID13726]